MGYYNAKESLIKSFDKALLSAVEGLRTNGKVLIPFVVSLSNALLSEVEGHEWDQLALSFLNEKNQDTTTSLNIPACMW